MWSSRAPGGRSWPAGSPAQITSDSASNPGAGSADAGNRPRSAAEGGAGLEGVSHRTLALGAPATALGDGKGGKSAELSRNAMARTKTKKSKS